MKSSTQKPGTIRKDNLSIHNENDIVLDPLVEASDICCSGKVK